MSAHHPVSRYRNADCRCDECRAGNVVANLRGRERRHAALLAGEVDPPHGVESTYFNYKCRCDACRAEHNRLNRERRKSARLARQS